MRRYKLTIILVVMAGSDYDVLVCAESKVSLIAAISQSPVSLSLVASNRGFKELHT